VEIKPAAAGLACELDSLTNLRYGEKSIAKFSFSPLYSPKSFQHLLVCFNTPRMQLYPENVTVVSAREHNPRQATERGLLPIPEATPSTIPDILANDRYFAQSFQLVRYDDFKFFDPNLENLVQWNTKLNEKNNCVVLSSTWQFNQVYEVRLEYANPAASASILDSENIGLWIASLSMKDTDQGSVKAYVAPEMLGPKSGVVCDLNGVPVTGVGAEQPRLDTTLSKTAKAGPRSYAVRTAVDEIKAQVAKIPALRTSEGLTALAKSVCQEYGPAKTQMLAGAFSDQIVPDVLFASFLEKVAPLIDTATVLRVNATLWPESLDDRRRAWPTRDHGLGKICTSGWKQCDEDGSFRDWRARDPETEYVRTWMESDERLDVHSDRRYRSLYTFKLMGNLLLASSAAYKCPALGIYTFGTEKSGTWPKPVKEL
jgi:hypothetical protein